MVFRFIPSFDVGSLILSRILVINTCVKDLSRREDVISVDVWNPFSKDEPLQ